MLAKEAVWKTPTSSPHLFLGLTMDYITINVYVAYSVSVGVIYLEAIFMSDID